MKCNDENLAVQKEHNAKKQATANETKNKMKTKLAKAKSEGSKGKKRKLDTTRELVVFTILL